MSNNKYTHTGLMKGCDNRTPKDFTYKVKLRKTKMYWVSHHNRKFKIANGSLISEDWPMYYLDIDSIEEIENDT